MSQFFISSSGGGGGGITSVVGQSSLVAPTTTVTTVGSTATVENRAWQTQYVVDPSSTQGLRGTFTTIQAAINQIVADGYSFSPFHTIFIRPGTYVENIVIPSSVGISLLSSGPVGAIDTTLNVTVEGNLTFTGTGFATFENILFNSNGSGISIDTTGAIVCTFRNCSIDNITGSGTTTFFNCDVNACSMSSNCTFWECELGGACGFSGTGVSYIKRCSLQELSVTDDIALTIVDSDFGQPGTGGTISSTGTFTGRVVVCHCTMSGQGLFFITGGDLYFTDIIAPFTNISTSIVDSGRTPGSVTALAHFGGNAQMTRTFVANHTVNLNDCFLGADTTGGAITFTLTGAGTSTSPMPGQFFEFKDVGGNALVNNITINGQPIDGGTSVVINTNYGSIRLRWDGTQYWIVT